MTTTLRIRRALLAPAFIALMAGCSTDGITGKSTSAVAGTYSAIVFRVTPSGQSPIDVLSQGGNLTIAIDRSGAATGTLNVPASAAGGTAFSASMSGTATVDGNTVRFQQTADTFVRNLSWTVNGQQLVVSNQVVAGTSYSITLISI